ncbi:MAG: hypothetical protein AB7O28_07555 [Vicinamibacterales bacterium]
MRCRFCKTEIADKALICYRCGRATADPRVAPPPPPRGRPWLALSGIAAAAAGLAAALPAVVPHDALWGGWAAVAVVAAGAAAAVWRSAGRRS